jgi:ParB family transcriptional regulator, chromosome partitioning protein
MTGFLCIDFRPHVVLATNAAGELADNIRQHGVLQPILLRPLPEGEAGTFELVAGTRRYRASKLAKCESIPATVRELTDAQALELQVIELSVVRKSFLRSREA